VVGQHKLAIFHMIRLLSLLIIFLAAHASSEVSVWALNENGTFNRQVQGENSDFISSLFTRELGLPKGAVPIFVQPEAIYFEDYLYDVKARRSSDKNEIVYLSNLELHQGKLVVSFLDERSEFNTILARMGEVSDTKFFIFSDVPMGQLESACQLIDLPDNTDVLIVERTVSKDHPSTTRLNHIIYHSLWLNSVAYTSKLNMLPESILEVTSGDYEYCTGANAVSWGNGLKLPKFEVSKSKPSNSLVYDEKFLAKFINPIAVSADSQNKVVAESNKVPDRVSKAKSGEGIKVEAELSKKDELDIDQFSRVPVAAESNKVPDRVSKAESGEGIKVEAELSKKNELDTDQFSKVPVAADEKKKTPEKQDLSSAQAELLVLKKQLETERAKAVAEREKAAAERVQIDTERRRNERERKKQEKLIKEKLKAEQERMAELARLERIKLDQEKEALEKKKKKRATSFSF
jgi:hypothetical protein